MTTEPGKSVASKPVPGAPPTWHDEMDRLFGSFFPAPWPRAGTRLFDYPSLVGNGKEEMVPRIDVSETDKAIEVTAELPGIDEKNVELSVSDGVLTIKGEKKMEREEKEKNYHMVERQYGSFVRSFELPEAVEQDKISAKFDKGVLTVVLPKTAKAIQKQRKIEIAKK